LKRWDAGGTVCERTVRETGELLERGGRGVRWWESCKSDGRGVEREKGESHEVR